MVVVIGKPMNLMAGDIHWVVLNGNDVIGDNVRYMDMEQTK